MFIGSPFEVMSLRRFKGVQIKSSSLKFHLATLHDNIVSPGNGFVLSEENKKNCIERLKKIKIPYKKQNKNLKDAAVLVPFCIVNGEFSLLYTLRSSDLKRHRGQVSFPGGVKDSSDINLEITAVRETEEELGIGRETVEVWGHGNPIIGTEFTVFPVLGFIGELDLKSLKPNPSEVELAFILSLKHLCDPRNTRYTQFRSSRENGYVLPVYVNGECRVWGMTALITHIVLSALIPDKYKNVLTYIHHLGV